MARLTRTVVGLGVVSLLTDAATEMALPLLPIFLTTTLAAPAVFLGVIEGTADAVAAVLKLVSGRISDRVSKRRPLVLMGYSLSGLSRPFLALALAPWHVLAVRVVDRVGKGVRSSPRDALLSMSAPEGQRGFVFGFHRAMDHAGAAIGPLLALAVLWATEGDLRWVFGLTVVPGVLAVLAILFLVKEAEGPAPPSSRAGPLLGRPSRPLLRLLLPLVVFGLGNASDVFLLLKVGGSRDVLTTLPLLWMGLHLVKSATSSWGGALADRVGPRRVVLAGWAVYAGVYLAFSVVDSLLGMAGLFLVYGLFHGLTEGPEKALVASLSTTTERGTAFGWYHLTVGLAALPAGLLFGGLWDAFGAPVAFLTGAGLAVVASLLLVLVAPSAPASEGTPGKDPVAP